jgi:hypothetical protein
MKKILTILGVSLFILTGSVFAANNESLINEKDAPVQFFVEYEKGLVSVLAHNIQIGSSGTQFDYVTQGGQDILFPFERLNVGAVINDNHRVSFLYQPLEINTVVPFEDEIEIDGKPFNGPMELKYGFPFWRVTYSYKVLDKKDFTLAVGAALQIRNASIIFKAVDGSEVSVSQNVGPVPALHIYSMWKTPIGVNLTADITGLYASSALINGANFEFEGSILDASLRASYELKNSVDIFANVRFLGGTSKGTSSYDGSNWSVSSNDDRFSQNNLATLSTTLGLTIR